MTVLYWLIAILAFGALVFIHEMGHYLTARLFGVKIYEFSIGMGPKMLTYTAKKTGIRYSLGIFPFGGYVSMAGEDEASDDPNALPQKPAWQRFIITFAGAFMNLLLGVILVFSLVLSSDVLGSTTIHSFQPDSYYTTYHLTEDRTRDVLQVGDTILRINGKRVHIAGDLQYEIQHEGYREIPVTVRRDGQEITLSVKFPTPKDAEVGFGVADFVVVAEDKTPGNVLRHTFYRSTSTVKMIIDSLWDLLTGRYGMESVSGPLGVADVLQKSAKADFMQFIYLVAVITINLGVVNLLPLPALDGGRLVFILFEMLFRRPVPVKYEGMVHFVGIVLLMILMVVVLFKDIVTLFSS